MKILVVNAGSSSLKYQVVDMKTETALTSGVYERIGIEGSLITHKLNGKKLLDGEVRNVADHVEALDFILKTITDKNLGCLKNLKEIDVVAHRVLFGGEKYNSATLIDNKVLKSMEESVDMAPLHMPANIQGIRACMKLLPNVPQVAIYDTAFHLSMPEEAYLYPIPFEDYKKYGIRKYGAHGTSHKYIASKLMEYLGTEEFKAIIMHIGSGASLSAVENGECKDTSMGLTPLDGVPMGTRSGNINADVFDKLCEVHNFTNKECLNYLNKKSGYVGMTGSVDARDVEDMIENRDGKFTREQQENAKLAMNIRVRRDVQYVGAYFVTLGGLDAIVFTAGLGENDKLYRKAVVDRLKGALGVEIDEEKNSKRGIEGLISTPNSKVKVFVIPTNEELQMAKEAKEVVEASYGLNR